MRCPQIDILLQAGAWGEAKDYEDLFRRAISIAVQIAQLPLVDKSELSIVLSDDLHIGRLNKQWRSKPQSTNVLCFPIDTIKLGETPGQLLGDIIVSRETIAREADELEISFDQHLAHMIIHGFLHIFGYDHIDDKDAGIMEELEGRCLRSLNQVHH